MIFCNNQRRLKSSASACCLYLSKDELGAKILAILDYPFLEERIFYFGLMGASCKSTTII